MEIGNKDGSSDKTHLNTELDKTLGLLQVKCSHSLIIIIIVER
jgi:hypothetical protein